MSTETGPRQRTHDSAPDPDLQAILRTGPHDDASIPEVLDLLTLVADWPDRSDMQHKQALIGAEAILRWLADNRRNGWQERWTKAGCNDSIDWFELVDAGTPRRAPRYQRILVQSGVAALVLSRIVLPSHPFLRTYNPKDLYRRARIAHCPELFAAAIDNATAMEVSRYQRSIATAVLSAIVLSSGRGLDQLEPQDFFDFYDSYRSRVENKPPSGVHVAWDMVRGIAQIPDVPLAIARMKGQRTAAEIVDRYPIACRQIRDVIIRYLSERRPQLDYASFDNLARTLSKFWVDIETHNPGIETLALSAQQASTWKERVQTVVRSDGTTRPRLDQLGVFVPIRAFYLDISQWALQDPSWAQWAVPCPVSRAETDGYTKNKQRVTARMHQRVRERLPRLIELADAVDDRRTLFAELLSAALRTEVNAVFEFRDTQYRRCGPNRPRGEPRGLRRSRHPVVVLEDLSDGRMFDLTYLEDEAFWSWAIVETLRHTGVRVEELVEITQLALTSYRLPDTGEHLPLLQVVPSKSNEERILLVSPELASVLATVISRLRDDNDGSIALISRIDRYELEESADLPFLFQRRRNHRRTVISQASVSRLLQSALEHADIRGVDGEPLRMTAHDFRRMFATEAVTGGLPVHLAARILGHASITTTQSYLAVFQDDLIRSYRRFLDRRRELRPAAEYREPTATEWTEFEQHFAARKLELGTCGRPYGSPCNHEHACIRCPMLRGDPQARPRLIAIIANLRERIDEARTNGWLGEIQGLETSRDAAVRKLAALNRSAERKMIGPVPLGIPTGTGRS